MTAYTDEIQRVAKDFFERGKLAAGGGGNRPGEDGPYRPPHPDETPPYPPKKVAHGTHKAEDGWA